jgi:hypothetical protein
MIGSDGADLVLDLCQLSDAGSLAHPAIMDASSTATACTARHETGAPTGAARVPPDDLDEDPSSARSIVDGVHPLAEPVGRLRDRRLLSVARAEGGTHIHGGRIALLNPGDERCPGLRVG